MILNAIYIVFTKLASFTGYEENVFQVIFNLHFQNLTNLAKKNTTIKNIEPPRVENICFLQPWFLQGLMVSYNFFLVSSSPQRTEIPYIHVVVCPSGCLFAPIGASFFQGLSLALRSHNRWQASHWSSPTALLKGQKSIFIVCSKVVLFMLKIFFCKYLFFGAKNEDNFSSCRYLLKLYICEHLWSQTKPNQRKLALVITNERHHMLQKKTAFVCLALPKKSLEPTTTKTMCSFTPIKTCTGLFIDNKLPSTFQFGQHSVHQKPLKGK